MTETLGRCNPPSRVVFIAIFLAVAGAIPTASAQADQLTLVSPADFYPGGQNVINIELDTTAPRQGLQLELRYDAAVLEVVLLEPFGRLEGALQSYSSSASSGLIRALFLDETAGRQSLPTGSGIVARIHFSVAPGLSLPLDTDLIVGEALIADEEYIEATPTVVDLPYEVHIRENPTPVLVRTFEAERLTSLDVKISWALAWEGGAADIKLMRVEDPTHRVLVKTLEPGELGQGLYLDRIPDEWQSNPVTYVLVAVEAGVELLLASVTASDTPVAPIQFQLSQNLPNPFNPRTQIQFSLVKSGTVQLLIYDVAGRLVKTLVDEDLPAGQHTVEWDGLDTNGRQVSTGVYLYRLSSDSRVATRKMLLLK